MEPMNRRVLTLDDQTDYLDMYRFILNPPDLTQATGTDNVAIAAPKSDRFEIERASTGEQALEKIAQAVRENKPFAFGFFDIRLGQGIDGVETIRRAKEIDPNLLCCIVTAETDRSVDEISRLFGEEFSDHWDFLSKPFSETEILQKAINLLSNWNRRHREKIYLDRIQAQQNQLVRSERLAAIGTLARGIGREMGDVLQTIVLKAELSAKKTDVESMREGLSTILTLAEKAGVVVRNLQTLVTMDSERFEMRLSEPIRSALSLLEVELKKGRVVVEQEGIDSLPSLKLSRVEVTQAFLNLFLNATQSMQSRGGKLKISANRAKGEIAIRVQDEGTGISAENLNRVFEPLFTTKPGVGSGIGLSVARRVIENHRGRIEVNSEEGKGTTFTIYFPEATR